mmetsp:Transcript_36686/g.117699  ORF Transcript_36686/g.117699 Transcript_36686/m.117699 type:complete len:315 (-) Transcript_36686:1250-2194(-)
MVGEHGPSQGLRVSDVIPEEQELVEVGPTATVGEALRLLGRTKFLSVPTAKHLGVFDLLDAALLLTAMSGDDPTKFTDMAVADAVKSCLDYRLAENPSFDPTGAIDAEAPLSELISMMWGGWHRVLAGDKVISQFDVVKFMTRHMDLLLKDKKQLVKDLFLKQTNNEVITAKASDSAMKVVAMLTTHAISAVPIVDDQDGRLVAVFSASDLRCLGDASKLDTLKFDVIEFLKMSSSGDATKRPLVTNGDLSYASIGLPQTCSPDDTLDLVLFKIVALEVHRLFVVDDLHKPIAVVSLSDLMQVFLLGGVPTGSS